MGLTTCVECGGMAQTCCGQSAARCQACKDKLAEETRKRLEQEAIDRRARIESGEVIPVNIAEIDPKFCHNCGLPKNWCNCEFKGRWQI